MGNAIYNTYPLGAMYVAGMLKQRGHEVAIYHDDVSNPRPIPGGPIQLGQVHRQDMGEECYLPFLETLDDFQPDVVGMSYCTVDAEVAHEFAGFVRQRGIRLVAGGIHPSLMHEAEMELFDAVVVGEGDHLDVAIAFEDDGVGVAFPDPITDLDAVLPDRDCVIGGSRYSPFLKGMIQTQRGCPYACSYCAAPAVFGRKVRTRDPGAVREEVEALGVRDGRIIDDSFGVNRKHGLAICRELAKTDFCWVCDAALQNLDIALLDALAEGGCRGINVGIESATASIRELSGKHIEPGAPELLLELAKPRDLSVVFYFMVGFPGELIGQLRNTLKWAQQLKDLGARPHISVVTPYPGTPLWEMVQQQAVVPDNWADFHHQSQAMGFANCNPAEWEQVLREADRINA